MSTPSARASIARDVVRDLEARADPERREHAASYTPSALTILGVPVPGQRAVLKPLAGMLRSESPGAVLACARALIGTGVHEARQVAFELVGGRADVIAGLDAVAVERLGRGNDNWASVDGFATYVSGPAWRDGCVRDGDVLRWARSGDRWWRRTALVSTVALNVRARGGSGDVDRTLAVCRRLAADRDPMVAKALSWALRSLVPVDREAVAAFLRAHEAPLAALVRREVGNKLRSGRKNPKARK